MAVKPEDEFTVTLTAAEWDAIAPQLFDEAFRALLKINTQLTLQHAKKEGRQPRLAPESA